jgi:hypothetical protein
MAPERGDGFLYMSSAAFRFDLCVLLTMDEPSVFSSLERSMLKPSSSANTRGCFIDAHRRPESQYHWSLQAILERGSEPWPRGGHTEARGSVGGEGVASGRGRITEVIDSVQYRRWDPK